MKKSIKYIIIIMLTFAILPYFNQVLADSETFNDYVKVGLKYGGSSVQSAMLRSDQGFIFGTSANRTFTEGMPLPAYTNLVITNVNGGIEVKDTSGTLISADIGSSGCIMPADYLSNGIIYFGETPYRGGIMFLANSNGTLTVINYIGMEHYLYGVINSELGYKNPKEALKAQAACARSFGQLNIGNHKSIGFDLCPTTHCQVYKGYLGEYAETNAAVDETKGLAICYDGKPVTAFYFKNSGGYTQNIEDVWSSSQPYLKAVKDIYSPSYPWSTSLSFDTIKQKLEAAGYNPGIIKSVTIAARNSSGAVSELKIVGSSSTVTLQKEKIRTVLGATIIKSLVFQLGDAVEQGTLASAWKLTNGSGLLNGSSEFYTISRGNSLTKVNSSLAYGFNGSTTAKLSAGVITSDTVTSGNLTLSGYGYGHGVGMPQDGAVEMAKQGFTFDQILKYYYTGVEIK